MVDEPKKEEPKTTAPGLVVLKSRIREMAKRQGLHVSHDFDTALNRKVETLIESASIRCKFNGRKTLMAGDL